MKSKICILIPAYNASKTIRVVVSGSVKYAPVIVADDGSEDDTAFRAQEAGGEVIRIGKNMGKGNALKVLFRRAFEQGYTNVITMDADGQHSPEDIPSFLAEHEKYPEDIIVGSRMSGKELIPGGRYNAMKIAGFFISLSANQYIEDTQCGFRLYPVSILERIHLTSEKFVTDTEILMKAGDCGYKVRIVKVNVIYNGAGSHFRPVKDIASITSYVIFYLTIKYLIEGVSSNKRYTYRKNGIYDRIGKNNIMSLSMQAICVAIAIPTSVFFLIEYLILPILINNNFASVRHHGWRFSRITFAAVMLPLVLVIAISSKLLDAIGIRTGMTRQFIDYVYPDMVS